MDKKVLSNYFKEWIRTVTGLDNNHVISLNTTAPRPQGQYVAINILNIRKIGENEVKYITKPNNFVDVDRSGVFEIMLSMDVYRGEAFNILSSLINSTDEVWTTEFFSAKSIGIINQSASRDLSREINNSWEERLQCDFFFYVTDNRTETVETIEHISGNGFGQNYSI